MSTKDEMKKFSRRDFLRLSGTLAGSAALLAACGGEATKPPEAAKSAEEKPAAEKPAEEKPAEATATPEPTKAPEVAAEAKMISWWNPYSTATTQEIIPPIVDQFQETTGIKVDYEVAAGGAPGGGDYMEVLLTRIAGGNPPDNVTLWSTPSQYGARGSLLAIDDLMASAKVAKADAFYEGPLASCQWQGKTYGLPSSAGAGAIFINKAKFEEKGISTKREDFPKTWDELFALSAQFTTWEGEEITQAGLVPWNDGWLKPVWSGLNGGKLFDSQAGAYKIDSAENVAWLENWVKWLDEQYQGDIEKLNTFGNWGGAYPDTNFSLGLSAITKEGSWASTDGEIPFDWEVAKFPVGPNGSKSVTGFWPNWWAIPTGAAHPNEAFLFCEYFCTDGWVPWYKAIMDTPAWKDFPAEVLTEKLVTSQGRERAQEIHNFFAAYLVDTVEMWNSPVEDFANTTLDAAVDEVLHKVKTPSEALAETQKTAQAKLEETLKQ